MPSPRREKSSGTFARVAALLNSVLPGGRTVGRAAGTGSPSGVPNGRPAMPDLQETLNAALAGVMSRAQPAGAGDATAWPARVDGDHMPDGAAFTSGSFTNVAGTRTYRLYIPSKLESRTPALIVMLHGCTQTPEDFATGTRMNAAAEQHGFLVVYPAQSASANPQRCWNWFTAADQRRDSGEPSLIAGITRAVMAEHRIDPRRVYVAGLSAGGAAAAIMGAAYPDLYAAAGVHSGLPAGAADGLPAALAAMRKGASGRPPAGHTIPTIVFHGDKDMTVNAHNGDAVAAQATALADRPCLTTVRDTGETPGGYSFSRTVHADANGLAICEQWTVHGAGHAWSGGSRSGSFTDPRGPDATREMVRFFLAHRLGDVKALARA